MKTQPCLPGTTFTHRSASGRAALLVLLLVAFILNPSCVVPRASAQTTAFTYQGFLTDAGAPANGVYDLTFTLFNGASGGSAVGASNVVDDLGVTNGLFNVSLNFGSAAFDGSDRWIEIALRPGASSGDYTNLVPRQQITSAPYAINALNFSGTIANAQLGGTYGSAVTFSNVANVFGGGFAGNGAGLTNLDAGSLTGTVADARLSTNVALRAGGNTFSGTQQVFDTYLPGPEALDQQLTNFTHSAGNADNWQSFTAGQSGLLTRIALQVSSPISPSNSPGTIRIYAGQGTNGTLLATESVTFAGGSFTFQTFPLTAPPQVQAGSQYTIRFGVPVMSLAWVRLNATNPYGDGRADSASADDYLFKTYVTPITNGAILMVNPPGLSGNVGIGTASPQARLHVGGDILASGIITGNGTGLSNLNASSIASGTLGDAQLSSNVALLNLTNRFVGVALLTNANNQISGSFSGNGTGLTALNASNLASGVVPDVRLSTNVPLLNGINQFTGTNALNDRDLRLRGGADSNHAFGWYGPAKPFAGFAPDGPMLYGYSAGGLGTTISSQRVALIWNSAGRVGIGTTNPATALDVNGTVMASSFVGSVAASQLSGAVALANLPTAVLVTNGQSGVNLTGTFSGNGSGLTNLGATNISSGTIADQRLSTNVALLNGTNVFSGTNRFAGVVIATNAINQFIGVFSGNGSGLTQFPASVVTNGANGITLAGTFSGGGSGLTSLSAGNVSSGTLLDSRLSANVALRAGGNTFSGAQQVTDVVLLGPKVLDQQQLTSASVGGTADQWQSFTAGVSGLLTNIALQVDSPLGTSSSSPGTISIYEGEGTSGTLLATQSVTWLNAIGTFQTNALSSPPFVQATTKYTIRFGAPAVTSGWVWQSSANPYPNGRASVSAVHDFVFKTFVTPAQNGATILMVNPPSQSGNVGIGTNAPQAKLHVAGNLLAEGTITGNGSGLTNLSLNALPAAVVTNGASGISLIGTFSGNGGGVTNLNATNLVGTVVDARLSTNVALRAGGNTFSGQQQVADTVITGTAVVDQQQLTDSNGTGNVDQWQSFTAGVSGMLTKIALGIASPTYQANSPGTIRIYEGEGINGALLATQSVTWLWLTNNDFQTNTLSSPFLVQAGNQYTIRFGAPSMNYGGWVHFYAGNPYPGGRGDNGSDYDYAFKTLVAPYRNGGTVIMINPANSGNVGIGTNAPQAMLHVAGDLLVEGSITGNGSGLTTLNASNLLSGTVADARLSTNVALLNSNQTFSGSNVFTGVVNVTGTLYGSPPYLKFAETTANADAGGSVAGTNNWREFNTEITDTHNLGSISGGDISLPAGTYQCRISAPAFRIQTHQIRLRTSTGTNLLFGTIGFTDESQEGSGDRSQMDGQFVLGGTTTLRVQHYCELARAGDGLGALDPFTWGDTNQYIFAVAEFWKIR